jgi:hypothetical protein
MMRLSCVGERDSIKEEMESQVNLSTHTRLPSQNSDFFRKSEKPMGTRSPQIPKECSGDPKYTDNKNRLHGPLSYPERLMPGA